MKNIAKTLIAGFIVVSLTACSVAGPLFVTDNPAGSKTGESSYRALGGFALDGGNAGIAKAAENGKITKISTVDQRVESGLLITRVITVVTGE
jgi:hypothetical protein